MVPDWFFMVPCPFLQVFMGLGWFQGGFMVFRGFCLVSMVFQVGFMVFHGFWLVSMVFKVVSWFLVGFHCFSRFPGGFSLSLMVPGWLNPG